MKVSRKVQAAGVALLGALAVLVLGTLARAQSSGGVGGPQGTILDFHTMTPVTGSFVGSGNPIRGVNGDTLPWIITHGDGTVRADGQVEVSVSGLVLANAAPVPSNQQGTNPSAMFVVIVSCTTTDASGAVHDSNVSTPNFAATPTGDAHVEAKVTLPTPCLAPVLFVAGSNGLWFAVTGSPTPTSTPTSTPTPTPTPAPTPTPTPAAGY